MATGRVHCDGQMRSLGRRPRLGGGARLQVARVPELPQLALVRAGVRENASTDSLERGTAVGLLRSPRI